MHFSDLFSFAEPPLYALHAPEVACISKGKARTPYEFGVKVSIATTLREGLVVGMRSMPGNPYDGHTLAETIEQVSILADGAPTTVIVDKGYQGAALDGVRILRSGQKRGLTRTLRANPGGVQTHRIAHPKLRHFPKVSSG